MNGFQIVESSGRDIPRISLVAGYILGLKPQEFKRVLEAPFMFLYGMAAL